MSQLRVTHTSRVTEDQIDHLGHMNVRFYAVNAHRATRAMLTALDGWRGGHHRIHDVYTRHHREQLLDTPLEVRSAFLGADPTAVRIRHELVAADSGTLAATFVHQVSPGDTGHPASPVPAAVVEQVESERSPLPVHAATRTIGLDADLIASAPSLAEVLEQRLEMRKDRRVGAAECDESGAYLPDMAPMLTWGGAPPEGQPAGNMLHETDDGQLMAWASMETRLTVGAWPRAGDRIQSFGAVVQLFDKVTHRIHWVFDLDTEALLAAFEVVSMAFDIRARRPMSLPHGYRAREEAALRPDLAPRNPT